MLQPGHVFRQGFVGVLHVEYLCLAVSFSCPYVSNSSSFIVFFFTLPFISGTVNMLKVWRKWKKDDACDFYSHTYILPPSFLYTYLMYSVFGNFTMTYGVRGFHPCPADSCSPGAAASQHTGCTDSSLNTDSWDPFSIYWSWREFMKTQSGQSQLSPPPPLYDNLMAISTWVQLQASRQLDFVAVALEMEKTSTGRKKKAPLFIFLVQTQCNLWNYINLWHSVTKVVVQNLNKRSWHHHIIVSWNFRANLIKQTS